MRNRFLALSLSITVVFLSVLVIQEFKTEQRSQTVLTFADTADGWDSIRMTRGLIGTEIELTPAEQDIIFSLIWNYDYIETTESYLNSLPVRYGGPLLRIEFQAGLTCYRWSFSNSSISLTTMLSDIPISTTYFLADSEIIDQLCSYAGGL